MLEFDAIYILILIIVGSFKELTIFDKDLVFWLNITEVITSKAIRARLSVLAMTHTRVPSQFSVFIQKFL